MNESGTPDALHTALVDRLRASGAITDPRIEAAFRTVPRHLFLPGTPLETAYTDQFVGTHRTPDGVPTSSASQPTIVATMLHQLDIGPGDRVLEIGAGTGYSAALLRELVGATGEVTTIDIDPDVTEEARARLAAAGYPDVHVIEGDGALGDKTRAPFDRLIITTGAWDVPPAWWEQLTAGGRLVIPLRWRGLTRSLAFDHEPGRMVARSLTLLGFIPMEGGDGEATLALAPNVTIHYDEDQPVSPEALHDVLDQRCAEAWSGVTVGGSDPFDGVWLRMSTAEPGTCRIAASLAAVETGRVNPAIPNLTPALVSEGSLAYLTYRRLPRTDDEPGRAELGAFGHGPEGGDLAERVCDQVRVWDRDRGAAPTVEAFPSGSPDPARPDGVVIGKRHTRLVLHWPTS
ncbi:protein-L-isoaspartate(D-aspartate) O-methyltransferase [Murinocardiopsis flavida]|uniref:Protein-L-isoaspartate O-methyltransferase n=1 Tax=Murinocardiopsis flavida TaxID=645275 RepID=A0A2P8CVI6_9ACTN|nr:methyltransferase, FxLD system [Murinocardiopsis flavida]PSK88984.1 protein-L-isoaspartate(D-aspartate) O-methyltransferase [Murinocardiopsis flavida]